jgi:hypothetical protein
MLCLAALSAAPAIAAEARRPDKVSFYFAAHEDDWQLFMNPTAFEDVSGGAAKTVFIHVTAGDAGSGLGDRGRAHPYYLARENGADNAIRFMADADRMPASDEISSLTLNGHLIRRAAYRGTVRYFLRLPDGNVSGDGFAGTGWQSLERFAAGAVATLTAIDNSARYRGWDDLVATVHAIMAFERGNAGLVQLNVAELDAHINPDDHSDHLYTARLALDAAKNLGCVRRVSYVDYASANLPGNLAARERDMESSVFAVTLAGVLAFGHGTSWRHYDESYVGKNYFRVAEPTPGCSAARSDVAVVRR